jgi:hypothetical protein
VFLVGCDEFGMEVRREILGTCRRNYKAAAYLNLWMFKDSGFSVGGEFSTREVPDPGCILSVMRKRLSESRREMLSM